MKRIAIDMDEVVADLIPKHLTLFNRDYEETLTIEDLKNTKLKFLRPHLHDEICGYLEDPTFFRDLEVIEGSQEVIQELHEHYEIFIATAAMDYPTSFTAKYEWLKEHFPFLNDQNFVFCGNKSIIHADYLIDDHPNKFEGFVGQGILFTAAHNLQETNYVRVNNWQEIRAFFLE
ncbi:5'(3')-deoxyribonucleotidase [Geomicrobium halophilum]|uniref:5'(3')-deoxyribonucleotidase n=1 Tax=Geomicrobium halophilum TaxID=549000 RepID=A0A841PVJ2_9BACL|nr:5'-3'-deoxyribonucleotidase [Geomicrobium halophilum]MBB6451196.1 5'(3')-deoxyribonucleotidase [Geomicrobium halophilum]